MRLGNDDLIIAGTPTDMGASFSSAPILIQSIVNYSIQLAFTDTPVGTLKLQISDAPGQVSQQPDVNSEEVVVWTDYAGSSQSISATGDHTWEVQNSGSRWVRFVWTRISGDGTLTYARFQLKGA